MIHVCSLTRLHSTVAATGAGRVVSLLSIGTAVERPGTVAEADHLLLSMHDIVDEQPDLVPPGRHHVEQLLEFARGWDRSKPLVVHCFAGISRSTAAAYIIAAALDPEREETELAATLRRASPSATPNSRLIALADGLLGRDGRMISAIAAIGRGADALEGVPFRLDVRSALLSA
ncbi:MAG: protein-tyrosine phosphatase family protein [Mesorhizobium sp.]|jgi:predicted protein tyrosine phosphatase